VDLDPQGHLTFTLGHNPDALTNTIYSAMLDDQEQGAADVILPTPFGVALAPINTDAAEADTELSRKPLWGACLKNVLSSVQGQYDYIIIDSGPNLSKLTVNAFMASDYVVIPTQLEMLSVRGLQQLLRSIDQARRDANRRLQIAGTVAMMAQAINAEAAMATALQQALGPRAVRVFNTIIPRSAIFKDVANARTVLAYSNPRNRYTEYYRRLLAELLAVVGGRAAERAEALPTGTAALAVKEA
jgi:chromosome partitioning protein